MFPGVIASEYIPQANSPPPSPSSPAGYSANLVRFDQNLSPFPGLVQSSQSSSNAYYFTLSMWIRIDDISDSPVIIAMEEDATPGYTGTCLAVMHDGSLVAHIKDDTFIMASLPYLFTVNEIHHIYLMGKFFSTKQYEMLLDGVNVIHDVTDNSGGGNIQMQCNGATFGIPAAENDLGSAVAKFDYADVWFIWNDYLPSASYLYPNGGYSGFITSGVHPADMGADGSNVLEQPTFFFTGAASNFTTNAGTGGTVTKIGSVSDVGTFQ